MLLLPVTWVKILLSSALRAFPPPQICFLSSLLCKIIRHQKPSKQSYSSFWRRKLGGGKALVVVIAGFPSQILARRYAYVTKLGAVTTSQ